MEFDIAVEGLDEMAEAWVLRSQKYSPPLL